MHAYRVKSSHPLTSVRFSGIGEDGQEWSANGFIQEGPDIKSSSGIIRLWNFSEIEVTEESTTTANRRMQ